MTSMKNEDLIANILKPCFPQAEKFNIKKHSVGQLLQHFTSDIIGLTVEFEQDGKPQSKQLVMKAPKHGQTSSPYEKLDLYNRETIMYKVMIPHIISYLDHPLIPVGYYATDSQILILENVTARGYVARDKHKLFSLEECYPILEALANFHAASFRVRQQYPNILNDSTYQYPFVHLDLKQDSIKSWEPVLRTLLERKNENSLIPKFTAAMKYLKKEDDEIKLKMHPSNFNFNVLNHGDFKISNLLLKYDTNDQVKDAMIIDFQTCFWSSPVLDIIYFFTMSVPVDVIEKNFETLVTCYLQCMNGRLEKLNCPERYTMHEFMIDFQNSSPLVILYIIFASSLLSPLDHSVIEKLFSDTNEDITQFLDVCLDDELFTQFAYGWLKFYEKMGAFDAFEE